MKLSKFTTWFSATLYSRIHATYLPSCEFKLPLPPLLIRTSYVDVLAQGCQVPHLRLRLPRRHPQPEEARENEARRGGGRRRGGKAVPVLALLKVSPCQSKHWHWYMSQSSLRGSLLWGWIKVSWVVAMSSRLLFEVSTSPIDTAVVVVVMDEDSSAVLDCGTI